MGRVKRSTLEPAGPSARVLALASAREPACTPGIRATTLQRIEPDGDVWVCDQAGMPWPWSVRAASTIALSSRDLGATLMVWIGADRSAVVIGKRVPAVDSPADVRVDGQRLVFDAAEEVVLRCGKSSITLRKDGRVAIRGKFVESYAEGTNRIKGGTVSIN